MTVSHGSAARNTLANALAALPDAGSGTAAGVLVILTSGAATLATLALSNPSFGASSGGTVTANAVTTTNASGTGTANNFEVRDRNAVKIYGGSITAVGGGGDMTLTNLSINSGDPISITSMTYSAPV